MGNEDTNTEVQPTDAENPGLPASGEVLPTPEVEKESGVQARINELTKKYRDQERDNQALRQQNQELMQTMTQTLVARSQPQEVPPEFDPEEKKRLDYLLSPLQKQIAQMSAQLAASGVASEVQAAAKSNTPPEVVAHAAQLAAAWRRQGIPGTPQDAITYAMGQYVLGKGEEEEVVATQRQNFNKGAGTVQTGQGGNTSRKTGPKQLSDAEVERLSPTDQANYYGSRVGNEEF